MYTDRDKDQILSDMLEVSRDDVDKREGAIVFDLLAVPAEEFELLQHVLKAVSENGFIDTAQMEYVDLRAMEYGEYRKPAEQAKGWLLIADKAGREINIDTVVMTEHDGEPIALQIVEYNVVPESGEVTVQAVAVEPGGNGNIPAYSDMTCVDLPEAIITNPIEFLGGVDRESDEELKSRVLLKVRKPITSGNIYHYELWARQIAGISQARVTPLWDGPGTVKVTVINSEGRAPTEEQVLAVAEHIKKEKPIGADVTVVAIKEVPINVYVELELAEGLIPGDVKEEVKQNIVEYLAEVHTEIRHSQIARAVLRTEGVKDYRSILIGTEAELSNYNITISADDVAVVGEVSLT
ncbi:baseplate J protein [Sporosarcina sp. P18a]|uniref:baseplate J/gp47 family protein n=1 Tax=Sporosarcina sp. P18a TaxID=2048259 RepID=UPI000C17379D|nr:baseplate J/gp47 family protein [Sporosarcina sp. P18a]PIC81022.1 baseplate J protein [Sporosarcina sp. P18a]